MEPEEGSLLAGETLIMIFSTLILIRILFERPNKHKKLKKVASFQKFHLYFPPIVSKNFERF